MRYMKLAAFVIMAVLSTAAMTQAQQMHAMKGSHSMHMAMSMRGKTTMLEGQVVGLSCYLSKGAHGESAKACQTACVKSGLPVGIVSHGHVYLAVTSMNKPANSLLLPYMEQEVHVTGVIHTRDGMSIVQVAKVEPAKGKWKK